MRPIARIWRNPIIHKELRARMRGWRAVVILIAQLVVLSCFASLIYFTVAEGSGTTSSGTIGQMMGQSLFYSTYMLLLVLVVFLSPAFTAGTISGERERKTLDLLITTLLPTRALVLGKLGSALAYMVILILVALPIQSLALMFGGVIFAEMVIGTVLLLVTALIAGAIGTFVSSLIRSSIASTVLTYGTILMLTVGLPVVAGILGAFVVNTFEDILYDGGWFLEALLYYVGGFLLSTNPFAVPIVSKILEDEQGTLFFFTVQLHGAQGGPISIPLVLPWAVYVPLCLVVSALLIAASIYVLERKRG
jgi:ABC-2 type transport system permease protein